MKKIMTIAAVLGIVSAFLMTGPVKAEEPVQDQDKLQTQEQLREMDKDGSGDKLQKKMQLRLHDGKGGEKSPDGAKKTGLDRADEAAGENGQQGRERAREMNGADKAKGQAVREAAHKDGAGKDLKTCDKEGNKEMRQERREKRAERRAEHRAAGGKRGK